MADVGAPELKAMNWLPTMNVNVHHTRIDIMKLFRRIAPAYADETFQSVEQSRVRRGFKFELKLQWPKMPVLPVPKYGIIHLLV